MAIPNKTSQVKNISLLGEYPLDFPKIPEEAVQRIPAMAQWSRYADSWYYDFKTVLKRKEEDLQKAFNSQLGALNAFRKNAEDRILALENNAESILAGRGMVKADSKLHFSQNADYNPGGFFYATSATQVGHTEALSGIVQGNGIAAPTGVSGNQFGIPYFKTASTIGSTLSGNRTLFLQGNDVGAPTWDKVSMTGVDGILPVVHGGTGKAAFTAGVVISPGSMADLTTVAGTANTIVKWGTATLADSILAESGTTLTESGVTYEIKPATVFGSSPVAVFQFTGKYNTAADYSTMAYVQMGKENATDGNNAGYFRVYTRTSGGANTQWLNVSSAGVVNLAQLTASKFVKTDSSKNLVSGDVSASDITGGQALTKANGTNVTLTLGGSPSTALLAATSITAGWQGQLAIGDGGSGQATANAALNAFLPSQATHSGKVLTTDGTNTSWIVTGGVGTVTSVGLTSTDLTVGGDPSPITGAGTFTLTLNTVPTTKGGTGITTYATGDMLYASAANVLSKLAIGVATGYILSVSSGAIPEWIQKLGPTHGGTDQTAYLQGDIIYASAVNTLSKLGVASGSPGYVLTIGGGNVPVWASSTSVLTTQGDILYHNATVDVRLPAGTATQVLKTGGSGANPSWAFVAYSEVTGTPTALPPNGPAGGDLTGTYPDPTIATAAVTLAKMANLATQRFIGRNTAGTGVPESLDMTTARTMLSISNVENTALSTWAGSTNLVTLGTITTGTWSGTAILVAKGGTGVATFTAGVVISPGTTTALTTVTGTADVIPKWGTNTLVASLLSDTGTDSVILSGARLYIKSMAAYNSDPQGLVDMAGKYDSGGVSYATMARVKMGKENATDGNDAGYISFWTKPNGGALADRIGISSTGVVTVSNLTASRPVYTDASKNLVSATVLAVDGGTGKTVYQVGDILYADTTTTLVKLQATTDGYVLTLASGVPTWNAPSAGSGTVTSVSVVTANGVSGSVATATTTPAITLTLGAITPTSVISVAAMTLGTSAGNANVLIVPNGTGRTVFGSAGNDIEITQGSNNSTLLFNSGNGRSSYASTNMPAIYATAGGGSGPFATIGALVLQPRTSASRDLAIAVFDGTNIIRCANFSSTGNVLIGDTITAANLTGAGGLAVQSATAYASEAGAIFTNGGISAIKGIFLGRTNATLGTIQLAGNTSGYCQIQPSAAAGSWTFTLPTGAGTNGYVLQTNGSGVTSWVAQTGGGGTVTSIGLTSSDFTVGGTTSPITGSGTFTLALNTPKGEHTFRSEASDPTVTSSYAVVDFGAVNFEIEITGAGTFYLVAHVHISTGAASNGDTCYARFDADDDTERLVSVSSGAQEAQLVLGKIVTQASTTTYQVFAKGVTGGVGTFAADRIGAWIAYFKLTN